MASKAYRKGTAAELELKKLLLNHGIKTTKSNFSGRGLPDGADVILDVWGVTLSGSVRYGRSHVPKFLYKYPVPFVTRDGIVVNELWPSETTPLLVDKNTPLFISREVEKVPFLFTRVQHKEWRVAYKRERFEKVEWLTDQHLPWLVRLDG